MYHFFYLLCKKFFMDDRNTENKGLRSVKMVYK